MVQGGYRASKKVLSGPKRREMGRGRIEVHQYCPEVTGGPLGQEEEIEMLEG